MMDMDSWIADYVAAVKATFGDRVRFIGLQGSRGRGEARPDSDIDVVIILDAVDIDDLGRYRDVTDKLPHSKLLCGFVSGVDELKAWDKADLFQFYFDTKSIVGNIDDLIEKPTRDDALAACRMGAGNIYHACSHNFLHGRDFGAIAALAKAARFVMQAKVWLETGTYYARTSELARHLDDEERQILALATKELDEQSFEDASALLLRWASSMLRKSSENMRCDPQSPGSI